MKKKSRLIKLIPKPVKKMIIHIVCSINSWGGKMTPPKWMTFVGEGDFAEIGNEFLQYFTELGGLKP